jgi:Holliday junction resolvasome RuvABC ATP-dependent DNA helicase subunit
MEFERKNPSFAKKAAGFSTHHMVFYGNPGTGKTTVARIMAGFLYKYKFIPKNKCIEIDGNFLKAGTESALKTELVLRQAYGGVLFIDEAYSLCGSQIQNGSTAGYGDEAIAVLLKKMEDSRGKFCVVFAGYRDQMKRMLSSNPGLESRVQFTLDFPDYTREELGEIAVRFASKKKYVLEKEALERILDVAEYYRSKPNFANARTVRNILDQVIMNQNLRTEDEGAVDDTIILQDVEDYISDENIVITSS